MAAAAQAVLIERARAIAAESVSEAGTGSWTVPSSSGEYSYRIERGPRGGWSCTCPHYNRAHVQCKHILRVRLNVGDLQ